jgi:hypothetical protein
MATNLLLELCREDFRKVAKKVSIYPQFQTGNGYENQRRCLGGCVTQNDKGKLGKKKGPYHKAKRGVSPGNHVNILGCKAGKSGGQSFQQDLLFDFKDATRSQE